MKKLTLLVAAALVGAAFAQGPQERGPRPPMSGAPHLGMDPIVRMVSNPKMAENLGITEEQKARLDVCLKGDREKSAELQKKAREAMQRQMKLLEAEKIDEAAVMAAIDEAFEIRKEMAKAQTRRVITVKSILTPEQIAKGLEELRQQREARREGRAPRGEGDRGPRRDGDRPGRRRGPHGDTTPPPPPPSPEK